MSFRNTLFGIVALYSGLAFAEPEVKVGSGYLASYRDQAEQAAMAAEEVVKRYQEGNFHLGCVETIDIFDSFDQGVKELRELYAKVPEEQRNNASVVELTARLNITLRGANQKLKEDYAQRCGFCNGLEREQCDVLDSYVSVLETGITKASEIKKSASAMNCNQMDQAYTIVAQLIEAVKDYEDNSQEYVGLLDLVKTKGLSEVRQKFWEEMNGLTGLLQDSRCKVRK